jgi:hypothetical protein
MPPRLFAIFPRLPLQNVATGPLVRVNSKQAEGPTTSGRESNYVDASSLRPGHATMDVVEIGLLVITERSQASNRRKKLLIKLLIQPSSNKPR